jgi:hypothetical protein
LYIVFTIICSTIYIVDGIHFVKWLIPTISTCSRWSQGGTYFGNALLTQGGAKVQLFWECLAPMTLPSVKDLQEFLYVSVSWEKGKENKKNVAISKYKMKNPYCGDGKIPLIKVSSKFTWGVLTKVCKAQYVPSILPSHHEQYFQQSIVCPWCTPKVPYLPILLWAQDTFILRQLD